MAPSLPPSPGPDPWGRGALEPRPVPRWFWLLGAVAVLFQVPFALLGEQRDAGELLVTADQLLRGHLPYTVGYMPKTPGVAYLLAGVFAVFGPHLLAARAAVVVANLLGGWAVACLARAQGWGGRTAFLAGTLYVFAAPLYEGAQILTEPFLVPLAVVAAFALLRCLQTGRLAWAVLAGASAAAACWMKQVGILVLPPMCLLLAVTLLRSPGRRGWVALAGLIFVLGWVAALGALVWSAVGPENREAFLNCVVFGLLARQQAPLFETGPLYRLGEALFVGVPALLLAAVPLVRRPAEGTGGNGPLWYTGGLLLCAGLPLLHRNFPHYYLPALPFAAVLAAVFWDATARRLSGRYAALVWVLALPTLVMPAYRLWRVGEDLREGANVFENLRVGRELKALVGGRSVLILGVEPEYYFLAGAEPPTPHLYLLDENLRLASPRYAGDEGELRRAVLAQLARQTDYDLIVTFSGPWDVWDEWPDGGRGGWEQIAAFPIRVYETLRYEPSELRVRARRAASTP